MLDRKVLPLIIIYSSNLSTRVNLIQQLKKIRIFYQVLLGASLSGLQYDEKASLIFQEVSIFRKILR